MRVKLKKLLGYRMSKIGIITINDDNNYGNRLQNYALQQFLVKHGHDPITIKNSYLLNKDCANIFQYFVQVLKFCIRKIQGITLFSRRKKCFKTFNRNITFSNNYITSRKNNINAKYDFFVVGSDQVWNPVFRRLTNIDLLTFADDYKKIAYAASFGLNNLHLDDKIKKAFESFKAISVRESDGKRLLEQNTKRKDIEVVVDPTMLLSAEEWDKVSKKPKDFAEDKYILTYFLGKDEKFKNEINKYAQKNGYSVVDILSKDSKYYNIGPAEFLYLEEHASIICTDSFHASVFAIIFHVPFLVCERTDIKMSSRLDTLINKFELGDRKLNGEITDKKIACNYDIVNDILDAEYNKASMFLSRALKKDKE